MTKVGMATHVGGLKQFDTKRPIIRHMSSLANPARLALVLHSLVVALFAAGLVGLDFVILSLEPATVLFLGQDFFDKGSLAVLVLDAGTVVFGGSFNNGTDLGIFGHVLAVFLFVVSVRVKDVAHLQQLEISLQLWGQISLGQVEPFVASSGLAFL